MRKIVLVGNGRSLLSRPGFGKVIDDFENVARFNDFHVSGFEEFVGTRTDWWIRNELPLPRPRPERFKRILLRVRMECDLEYARTAEETMAELRVTHADTPVELVDRNVFLQMRETLPFRNAPLTGTLVVGHLLRRYDQVHVCGFDGLQGPGEALRHYYSDANRVDEWTDYHDPDLDARYLRARIDEGRLVVI